MPDYYEQLLGSPSSQDTMMAAARRLRGQEALGTLGVFTGDPVLSQWGQQQLQGIQPEVARLSKARSAMNQVRPSGMQGYILRGNQIEKVPGWDEHLEAERQHELKLAMRKQQQAAESWRNKQEMKEGVLPENTYQKLAKAVPKIDELGSLIPLAESTPDLSMPYRDIASAAAKRYGGEFGAGLARMAEAGYRSQDARSMRSAIADAINEIRNSQFGAALTVFEEAKFAEVDPLAPGLEREEMVSRLKRLVNKLTDEAQTLRAGRRAPGTYEFPQFMDAGWEWNRATSTPRNLSVPQTTNAPEPPAGPPGAGNLLQGIPAEGLLVEVNGKRRMVYPDGRMEELD